MQQVTRDLPSTASSTDDPVAFRTQRTQGNDDSSESKRVKKLLFVVKVIFGIFFYVIVLVSTVFSKLTLVNLTHKLRTFTTDPSNSKPKSLSVALYWQLLLVIMIPTFITFVRSLVSGVLGKTTKTFPWPTMRSAITVSAKNVSYIVLNSVFECTVYHPIAKYV